MGGSAGAIEPLKQILSELPRDLPATVFIVVHLSPTAHSALPAILSRVAKLPVRLPVDGECFEKSTVYVAPPDFHLAVDGDQLRLTRGPRENRVRPAVDVLFRSAAQSCGSRVVAVELSGGLDDGAAGMAEVKMQGGFTIVQDPQEASVSGMPSAAIRLSPPDRVLPAAAIAGAIEDAIAGRTLPTPTVIDADPPDEEPEMVDLNITCPDCSGVINVSNQNGYLQFECQVGHRFSEEAMLSAQADDVEAAMWVAVRALEER